jgi:hypothetical protein
MVHCYGDVPIEVVLYAVAGHTGAEDIRCSQDDPSWDIRSKCYDDIMPDEAREKARVERVRAKDDPSLIIDSKALSIVAVENNALLQRMSDRLMHTRSQRDAKRRRMTGEDNDVHDPADQQELNMDIDDVADDVSLDQVDATVELANELGPGVEYNHDSEEESMYAMLGL